jgi:peptide/nickel transport system ATP-binding protein
MINNNIILEVKGLTVKIKNNILLNSVSFEIKEGEVFALIGESGSGKSLTSLAIMRLLPDTIKITAGEIYLRDKPLFKLPEYQMQKIRGNSIAMIFQEPMIALNPVITIGKQVAEIIKLHLDLKRWEIENRVVSLFNEVGIREPHRKYSWYPHQLSGGERQRVIIAMALACEPDLLIADEPTTALDVTIQAQVLNLLKNIQRERSLSILFITHDIALVAQMADRVAIMRDGNIVEQSSIDNFFTKSKHPYSKQLIQNIKIRRKNREVKGKKILEVKDLKVYFPIKKGMFRKTTQYIKAVNGVSLSIESGKSLALVGESGSGKSTIGQALLRLLDITAGSIIFNGIEITHLSQKELRPYRKEIQIIFQDPYSSLNPRMSVGEIIREGMVSLGVGDKTKNLQNKIIEELLVKVGLQGEYRNRYPHEFSGGERQRIGIARALAVKPKLIICDEPTSALDVSVRSQVLKLLKKLQQEENLSYLFITHDLSLVPMVADNIAVMQYGKIVEQGSVDKVMKNPKNSYTKNLLNSAPKLPKK